MVLEIWPPAPCRSSLNSQGRATRRELLLLHFAESRNRHPCNVAAGVGIAQADRERRRQKSRRPSVGACLAAVRSSNADPGVPDPLIVDLRIIDHDIQTQSLHRQSADRRQQRLRSNDAIVLRSHQSHARVDQFLLRVEDVKRGSLPDPRLFAER
jgi:hypothetical protein